MGNRNISSHETLDEAVRNAQGALHRAYLTARDELKRQVTAPERPADVLAKGPIDNNYVSLMLAGARLAMETGLEVQNWSTATLLGVWQSTATVNRNVLRQTQEMARQNQRATVGALSAGVSAGFQLVDSVFAGRVP